jgi:hypothetical protein
LITADLKPQRPALKAGLFFRNSSCVLLLLLSVFGGSTTSAQDSLSHRDSLAILQASQPANPPAQPQIIPWRLATVASLTTLSYVGSYYLVLKKGWWSGEESGFHFANDFDYALNLDKLGHFYSGILISEFFYDALLWSGLNDFDSYLWGGLFSTLTHVGIDIKDGFAPEWGYSVWDVIAGTLGGFYPMGKHYIPAFAYIDFKMSYWQHSDAYFEQSNTDIWTDDYVNQTYWLSFKLNKMLPHNLAGFWPDILAPAAGLSVTPDTFRWQKQGQYEVYLSLDWDLEAAIKPQTHLGKRSVRYLNYVKWPSPTIQVFPETVYYLAFPLRF